MIAVNGLRLNLAQLEQKLVLARPGERWQVHAFRRDELHRFEIELQAAADSTLVLQPDEEKNEAARRAWLHG